MILTCLSAPRWPKVAPMRRGEQPYRPEGPLTRRNGGHTGLTSWRGGDYAAQLHVCDYACGWSPCVRRRSQCMRTGGVLGIT